MRIIVVMPVKNEEWILEKSLACLSLFTDRIIVADQNSNDRSIEICKKFRNVEIIENKDGALHQSRARQLLLDKAREYGKNNVILALDADEALTANCVTDNKFLGVINNLKPGQSIQLEWIILWRDPNKYRKDDSVWSNSWKHFIFRDDGVSNFADKPISEPRVPENFMKNYIKYEDVKVLHYQFVDWERMLSKQRRYRIYEYLNQPGLLNAIKINQRYYFSKDERNLRLEKIPSKWVDRWSKNNINFNFNKKKDFYWCEEDILKFFKKYSTKFFKWLDIWDPDWERKRQIGLKRGIKNLPEDKIKDPRPFYIKFYHKHLQPLLSYNSFLYEIYRFVKRF